MHHIIQNTVAETQRKAGGTAILILARATKNPAARAGFLSLPERDCLASRSVFGDDRSRKGEVIVQAGADDVAGEAGSRDGGAAGKERPSGVKILQRAEAIRDAAEIIIQIFGL